MIKRVGIIVNLKKRDAGKILRRVSLWLKRREIEVISDAEASRVEIPARVDLILVLGGDGTLLNVAPFVVFAKNNPPVMGVNLGGLGFLTEIVLAEVYRRLEEILKGKMQISPRMMLGVQVEQKGARKHYAALNDVVISRGARSRIINLGVSVGGEFLCTYMGDGLIISTATGSTAHSLSAGGPIIYPNMEAVVINPICAHTLTQRPLIIPGTKAITITSAPDSEGVEVAVMVDGQIGVELEREDAVRIKKFPRCLKLITSPECTYFQLLRERLGWGLRRT